MKYSSLPSSVRIGAGSSRCQDGKRVVSDSVYGRTSDVWKTGKMLGEFGKSRVTVECSSSTSVIIYGPSYRGMNFATRFSPFAL